VWRAEVMRMTDSTKLSYLEGHHRSAHQEVCEDGMKADFADFVR